MLVNLRNAGNLQDEEASGDELIPNWEELFNKVLATCSPKLAEGNSEPPAEEAPADEEVGPLSSSASSLLLWSLELSDTKGYEP